MGHKCHLFLQKTIVVFQVAQCACETCFRIEQCKLEEQGASEIALAYGGECCQVSNTCPENDTVCGSDGLSYENVCTLEHASCMRARRNQPLIVLAYRGAFHLLRVQSVFAGSGSSNYKRKNISCSGMVSKGLPWLSRKCSCPLVRSSDSAINFLECYKTLLQRKRRPLWKTELLQASAAQHASARSCQHRSATRCSKRTQASAPSATSSASMTGRITQAWRSIISVFAVYLFFYFGSGLWSHKQIKAAIMNKTCRLAMLQVPAAKTTANQKENPCATRTEARTRTVASST